MSTQSIRTSLASRVASIDILRALTMVLMIFVNDLWSLKNIPAWLEHVETGVDGIGLADVVFPAFLFIVGLSIPYAIDNRRKKGDSQLQLVLHVLFRTIGLLTMGLFLVNGESFDETATGMPSYLWNPICCMCFILIWNAYPASTNKILVVMAKSIGILTLLALAYIYRGNDGTNIEYFAIHWWGILGLIGWAYLASGLIAVFARNNIYVIGAGWIFFAALSIFFKTGIIPHALHFIPEPILGGTLTGLTLGGVLTAMIFQFFRTKNDNKKLFLTYGLAIVIMIVLSVITRPYWGLAKLGATPAWLFLCSAFTLIGFAITYWIADIKEKASWFNVIKPAGTDTLLCYLIPYFAYAGTRITGIHIPELFLVGALGLLKSFLFAILCAVFTGLLFRIGIRLKL